MEAIVQKLESAISDFSEYMRMLPSENFALSKTVRWGPREVLCHIVFWHEQYCQIQSALLKGQKPQLVEGSFKENNELSVRLNKDESKETLLKRLTNAQNKLSLLCKDPQAKQIKIAFKAGGISRLLPDALIKIAGHIRSHQRQLIRAGFK